MCVCVCICVCVCVRPAVTEKKNVGGGDCARHRISIRACVCGCMHVYKYVRVWIHDGMGWRDLLTMGAAGPDRAMALVLRTPRRSFFGECMRRGRPKWSSLRWMPPNEWSAKGSWNDLHVYTHRPATTLPIAFFLSVFCMTVQTSSFCAHLL